MSAGDSNPYVSSNAGAPQYAPALPPQDSGFSAIGPLLEATGWLKLLGWTFIIAGALQCLTIVGILIAWLPIWMGISLKNAGERLAHGGQTRGWQSVYDGCKDLKTYFTIMGVLMIINIVIGGLYLLVIIALVLLSLIGGVASNM